MRSSVPLNDDWRFCADYRDEYRLPSYDDAGPGSSFASARLPHTSSEVPYSYFDERVHQGLCCYRRELPARGVGPERLFLCFEGVMAYAEVFVDGARVGDHKGGYTPFEFDVTDFLRSDAPSLLCVAVDTREREDIPPFGGVVDYLTYGGIYREVRLESRHPLHLESLAVRPSGVLGAVPVVELFAEFCQPLPIVGDSGSFSIVFTLSRPGSVFAPISAAGRPAAGGRGFSAIIQAPGAELWDIDHPALYDAEATLLLDEEPVDSVRESFGFREAVFRPDGFFLNGRRLKLRGLNRHQSYPYVGCAMPRRVQRRDADILKFELGCNIVRSSHYPPSRHFLDRCDQIGLLVFEELPGWRHIGGEDWKQSALSDLGAMILRDRNRPSVVLWGVRINESSDDDEFYRRTNALARKLDPTRQTGGVRDLKGSSFLEDVYTYNDFLHSGGPRVLERRSAVAKRRVPYLVTEHNGHMFPTKSFDPEDRRVEHALRHLRVLDAAYARNEVSGAIGWCLADYNTHREFGSGDRVCRHGVLDMFRVPKYAAAAYASQREGSPFGFVASELRVGDRDGGSIGRVYVFTNSECVKVFKNDALLGVFRPDRRGFPHLPHPPVSVDDLIGDSLAAELRPRNAARLKSVFLARVGFRPLSPLLYARAALVMLEERLDMSDIVDLFTRHVSGWGGPAAAFRFEGYSGDRLDWTIVKGGVSAARALVLRADDRALSEGRTWDATRVEASLVDEYGNVLPYAFDPVELRVSGPLEVVGPACRSLEGGRTAFWVRTCGSSGAAKLSASCGDLEAESLSITIQDTALSRLNDF